jgi:C_GCAxxG_C_C family probable redox protein
MEVLNCFKNADFKKGYSEMQIPRKPKDEILREAESKGYEFERIYHGCAQCVLAPLMDIFNIKQTAAFKAATGLAGGIGLSVEGSCGGLSGGVMAFSLIYGRELDKIDDPKNLRFISYRLANQLHERFIQEYGSSICKEIHKKVLGQAYHLNNPEEWDAFLAAGGHTDKCPGVVGKATRWAAEIIMEEAENQEA